MEPRLYKGVVDESGQLSRVCSAPPPIRRVISPRTVVLMKTILKGVVDEGTGKAAQVVGLSVAGKTGTAQKIDPKTQQYSDAHYLASFCGFAPVDHPRLVIGVFLDEPQSNYWGGSEAAPLFARILKHAAPYLKLQSESVRPSGDLARRVPHPDEDTRIDPSRTSLRRLRAPRRPDHRHRF